MVQSRKLKALLVEKGLKQQNVSASLGITLTCFNRKINNKSVFSLNEVNQLYRILGLKPNEFVDIFLG